MRKGLPLILLVVLAIITLAVRQCNKVSEEAKSNIVKTDNNSVKKESAATRGLNRNPSYISYSKHARCRMECRHISESEVKEILKDGKINYTKSELQGNQCNKKYAVEGYTQDNQRVRIIFAPCNTEVTVVTVIDLGKEWICNCD